MARVVIIGAGLTGLSTAYHLEKNNVFDFKIFEKNNTCGGLARSIKHNGFTFDFTGHLLHSNNPYFTSFINTMLPQKNTLVRKSFIYYQNTFIKYPFQANLHDLPATTILECICGFAKRKHFLQPKNFHEWVLKYFGSGLAKHFFLPYNKKLLTHDLKKVSHTWTQNFVPKITIQDIIKSNHTQVGYNHTFMYPKTGGIQTLVDNLAKTIKTPIHKNYNAQHIDLKKKLIYFENGHVEAFDILISTMPLNTLLQKTKEPSSSNLRHQHKKLLCNSVLNFNIGFKTQEPITKHWVYVPEKTYNFYRIGFWHNFAASLAPPNASSMYGEIAYRHHKPTDLTLAKQQALNMCHIQDVMEEKILDIPHAYVIYDHWREKNLHNIHKRLQASHIYAIGRYGAWKYSSMQDAIMDGKQMAEHILKQMYVPAVKSDIVIPRRRRKETQLQGE